MADNDSSIEEWRDIPGYEGLYSASDMGRIRTRRGRVLKERLNWGGYNRIRLTKDGRGKDIYAHVLVAAAFIGPKPAKHDVNHINNVRADNRIGNLEYVTRSENIQHQRQFNNFPALEKNPRARLTQDQVREIRIRRKNGETMYAMAKEYGVHKNTIRMAAIGETWPNI